MAADEPVVVRPFDTDSGSFDLNFESASVEPRKGFRRVHVILGGPGNASSPQIYWAQDPPGVHWDSQSHNADFLMAYLQGSQKVGDRWYRAGDARVVKAGTVYGPIEAGPEGSTAILVFAHADYQPNFEEETADESKGSPYFQHAHLEDD
jgi:hypothetical protein